MQRIKISNYFVTYPIFPGRIIYLLLVDLLLCHIILIAIFWINQLFSLRLIDELQQPQSEHDRILVCQDPKLGLPSTLTHNNYVKERSCCNSWILQTKLVPTKHYAIKRFFLSDKHKIFSRKMWRPIMPVIELATVN